MQIQFFGAAQMVTGSKHLLTTPNGVKILLDCGLVQGKMTNKEDMNQHFGFNPMDLDYVILSHAHIDHSGLLPKLVKEGFNGIIFCTPATKSLCEIMLLDSAFIQNSDLKFINKRRRKKGLADLESLYDEQDVYQTLQLMQELDYDQHLKIDKEINLHFTDVGHLIGSAAV
ncbi:MAG: MBL fold metallo-hydrolase, partial [Bacteroidia bacterium]